MFSFNCFYFLLRYIQDAVIFLSDFLLSQYSILQLREEFLKFLIVHLYKMFPINHQLSPRLGWFFYFHCSTAVHKSDLANPSVTGLHTFFLPYSILCKIFVFQWPMWNYIYLFERLYWPILFEEDDIDQLTRINIRH